jgi:succinyl-CoA synthetase alpha subunit
MLQATANAKDSIGYGTNIVGGVTPGKGGSEHLDRPVFHTVREVRHAMPTTSSLELTDT